MAWRGGLNLSRIYPQEAREGRGLVQAGGMVGMRFENGGRAERAVCCFGAI